MIRIAFCFATLVMFSAISNVQAEKLLVCGMDEVFVVDTATAEKGTIEKLWSWRAKEHSDLPANIRTGLRTTDDCKSIDGGAKVLISSSGGASALVEYPSGKVLWYAMTPMAHSLELLPNNRVVVACSVNFKGNRLMLFDVAKSDQPLFEPPLFSAHGVVWDAERRCLWALGHKELQSYELKDWETDKPSLALQNSYPLPCESGHDLQAVPNSKDLVVSTGNHVYLFHRDQHQFRPHPDLSDIKNVKCVSIHPESGRTVFLHDDGKNWWNNEFGLLGPAGTMKFPGEKLYKARWLQTPAAP
jgi:hypothetical protein